jgi:UDP-N-acetylglucosamine 1-carboxyvinyltransferase
MDTFLIQGGRPLAGEVAIERIPAVRDVRTMEALLTHIGAGVAIDGGTVTIEAGKLSEPEAPYELVKTMRASSLVLGPLVGRTGRARVSMPGGCAIGARPINLHVSALE